MQQHIRMEGKHSIQGDAERRTERKKKRGHEWEREHERGRDQEMNGNANAIGIAIHRRRDQEATEGGKKGSGKKT